MSFQIMASNSKAPNNGSLSHGVSRRTANYQPSAWGDYFLCNQSNIMEEDEMAKKQLEELREEVRSMFGAAEKYSQKLSLIDLIQRLGLSYHFEDEINEILDHIQNSINFVVDDEEDEDLYIMALKFRLLRQHGFFVSSEIFNKFRNERGDFKESISKDENGLLSLYEASHLRMRGENILDKALAFTTTHLKAMAMDSNSQFSQEVKYALEWPIYKAMPRFMAKDYISLYNKNPLKNNVLLTFAKLDYNSLQKFYQKELGELSRWWKDMKLMEQLPFARDRVVENYVWALSVFYEPKCSSARIILTKVMNFVVLLDDMYDVYATLEELELFTDAIERWDVKCIENLPNFMKVIYEALLEVYGEVENVCIDNNIPFAFDYAKEGMIKHCQVYLVEAKWFNKGYVPTMEEYIKIGAISISIYVLAPISFLGLGNIASEEVFQWVQGDPITLQAGGAIGRLMNDISAHKFERERLHDETCAVECYMEQYGVSIEEAMVELEKEVVEAWKDMVEDYIKFSKFPKLILNYGLNIVRGCDFYYKEKYDSFTFADRETKHVITLMLIHPFPV